MEEEEEVNEIEKVMTRRENECVGGQGGVEKSRLEEEEEEEELKEE